MPKIGSFVSVKTNNWGTGKLVRLEIARREATVEYFDSPTTIERPTVRCPVTDLLSVGQLGPETRVYFYDSMAANWRMGRISGHIDDTCFVSLPNKAQARLSEAAVYVRWAMPLADPIDHLKAMLTETPFFHGKRQELVGHLVRQRSIASGLIALLSAPVFLERHQLEVVARVLSDPIQRYLLADEVGLGKTIEAGMIARQHVLDHPEKHNVVAVVPTALTTQWWRELIERCHIGGDYGHNVVVLSYDQFLETTDLQPDLLIIDEAHQITRPERAALYHRIREVSHPSRCAKLLLLSATPIRGNALGFLSLLHLLDPAFYRLEAGDEFRARVEKRQELADIFVTLTDDQSDYFLEQTVSSAGILFPQDSRLQALAAELLASLQNQTGAESKPEERKRLIISLRSHLAESYRLDRRLLRNRRSGDIEGLLPGRAGLTVLLINEDSTALQENFVDLWRARIVQVCVDAGHESGPAWECVEQCFASILQAAWTSADKFVAWVKLRKKELISSCDRRRRDTASATPTFEGELEFLQSILEQSVQLEQADDRRLDAICAAALQFAHGVERLVIMCTDPTVADTIYRRLNIRSTSPIIRCRPDRSHPETWLQKGLLVCDGTAEEGLNLQGGSTALLHVDLPLSPNRLEQRIGRLDRIGIGRPVKSAVIVSNGTKYFSGWLELLNKGWGVFSRSIASLQYLVEDEMNKLRHQLLIEGSSAFSQNLVRVSGDNGVIQTELRQIRNQDELDALCAQTGRVDALLEGIESYERSAESFSQAMNLWLIDGLGFQRVGEEKPDDPVGRYHYRSASRGGHQTLISQTDFLRWFRRGLDEKAEHKIFSRPLSWSMAARRETALRRRVAVARVGHPWIDAVAAHLRWDDRGTAVAFWRTHPQASSTPKVFIRFTAIAEANTKLLQDWCQANLWANSRTVLRIADTAFPPLQMEIWVGPEFQPPEDELARILQREYDKGSNDANLSADRWPKALEVAGLNAESWFNHCDATRRLAEQAMVEHGKVTEATAASLQKQETAHAEVIAQLTSRREALTDQPDEQKLLDRDIRRATALHEIVQASIRQAHVRFDSVAATFLSRSSLA